MKKAKPRKSKAKGVKGGKPGNQNARKHGLYAKKSPPPASKEQASGLERRRQYLDDVIETLYTKFHQLQDIDQICKCANSLSLAVTAANGCDRTIAIVSGKLTTIESALKQLFALEDPNDPRTIE